MININEYLLEKAVKWHSNRFPDAIPTEVALKAAEELGEVATEVLGDYGNNSCTGKTTGRTVEEAADVVITLLVLTGRWYPNKDLMIEVAKKLDILSDPNSGHRAAALA